jgi:tetratricopeptide (TPR) repeat protein
MRAVIAAVLVAASCGTAPPAHRTHLGAIVDLPGDVQLAEPPPAGRTDDDRAKAKQLLDDGVRLRDSGDLAGSQRSLEEALQLDASLARAHVEWALTAEGLAVEPALINAHYQLGARLAPDDARTQVLAAAWAARQGDADRALEGYDRALKSDPKNVDALCRRADLLLSAKSDATGAVTSYQKALDVDAKSVPALMGLADAAEKAGSLDVAEKSWHALIDQFPDAPLYRTKLIEFFRRTHQKAKASEAQRDLDKLQPRDTRRLRALRH